jgi:hypothetical protein
MVMPAEEDLRKVPLDLLQVILTAKPPEEK